MLWRACDQPSTIVLPNCQEASQRQQLLLSRHLSPSSITLIKCSSCHSVSDKTRQWLDQSSIKKKRSWPCTTWRCTGRHCASKSCNWERPSRPPLSKRMTFDLVKSNLPLWKRVIFSKEKWWIFPKIPWSFLAPQFWCARVSIFLQSDIFQMIEYNQINNSLKIHQSTKTAILATELVVFHQNWVPNITLLGTRALTELSSKMFEKGWTCWNSRRQRGKDKHEKLPS